MRDNIKFDNGRDNAIVIAFKKNICGDFIYDNVFCVKQAYTGSSSLTILSSSRKGLGVSYSNCIETDKLLPKLNKKKPISIVESVREGLYDASIYIILGKDIEYQVYEKLKSSLGKDPSNTQFFYSLALYADKIGRNIDKISPKGTGKNSTYEISIKGDIDLIPDLNKEDVNKFLSSVFTFNNVKESEVSISMGAQNPSRQNLMTFKTSGDVKRTPHAPVTNQRQAVVKNKEESSNSENVVTSQLDAQTIKDEIRKKVIAQDGAIDKIVNNIYLNQRYIDSGDEDILRSKANILLDGPTGTGKTFILQEVSSQLKLPIVITPATNYSSVGYRGADITEILVKLLEQADGNLEVAQRGIVAFDEFDKLGKGNINDELSMRIAMQEELLTFISGTKFNVDFNGTTYEFDTSKLTIIGMGAFTNLHESKIAENERKYKSPIGFSGNEESDVVRTYSITKDDYINEGLKRELVGRFSCLASTNELGIPELKRILTESSVSPLKHLVYTGKIIGCDITFEDDLIEDIATMAFETNVGARGLIQIVQSLKDVIANDLVSMKKEIKITHKHLEQTKKENLRTYNARSY